MGNLFNEAIAKVKDLRFRDVIVLIILGSFLSILWVGHTLLTDVDKVERLVQLNSGEAITGSVGNCILLESRKGGRPSFQVLRVFADKNGVELGAYTDRMIPYQRDEAVKICKILNDEIQFTLTKEDLRKQLTGGQ